MATKYSALFVILSLVSQIAGSLTDGSSENPVVINNKVETDIPNLSTETVTTKHDLTNTIIPPNTTVVPQTTTPATNTITTTLPTTTVIPTSKPNTTTVAPNTTTTITPTVAPTTTQAPITISTTTSVPFTTTAPHHGRHFDGPSFIGGIILASGLMGIAFVSWKFYKARTERNYHTL